MTTPDINCRSERHFQWRLFGVVALATLAITPVRAENVSQCARYGADYVPVAGSNGCVRLGGHVRVAMPRTPVGPMGYAELPRDGMRHAAAGSSWLPMAPFGLRDLFPR